MKLVIEDTSNGYILTVEGQIEIDNEKICIEETDEENSALKKLLEAVAEHCGYQYDKFGNENLEISFTGKGSKVD